MNTLSDREILDLPAQKLKVRSIKLNGADMYVITPEELIDVEIKALLRNRYVVHFCGLSVVIQEFTYYNNGDLEMSSVNFGVISL